MASPGPSGATTAWWNSVSTVEEFAHRAQLSQADKDVIYKSVNTKGKALAESVYEYAKFDMTELGIDFAVEDRDIVIEFWIRVFQKPPHRPSAEEISAFRQALAANRKSAEQGIREGDASYEIKRRQQAFNAFERPAADKSYPSASILKELEQQFEAYAKDQLAWMGPYTTVIGPSGVGKSFMMKQLAVRHGVYVSYSNLAPSTAMCYPRPVVLGRLPIATATADRTALVGKWETFLNQQLELVRFSREAGITAPGLFALMTSPTPDIVDARWELKKAIDDSAMGELNAALAHCRHALDKQNENVLPLTHADRKEDDPILLCLDEARALLHDESDNMSFRALRQAAKEVFGARQDESPFFLVLLDTTSRISHFAPPIEQDPSRKLSQRQIFPPVYQINTWDLFAPDAWHAADGTDGSARRLFSYGRPLWGANMDAGDSPSGVVRLATAKMAGKDPTRFLALLSYRVNFYITSRQLAETLVASWMRYLVSFTGDNKMLTAQPSEPVLAFASSRELQDPQVRLSTIKSWFGSLQEGACNLGDVGEMLAALILLFAADHASKPLESLPHALPMGDFWASLAGKESWLAVQRRYADVPSVLAVLEHGKVFFNHFVRMAHDPTPKDLASAYRRGAALFLPANFPGMDIAIPILCTEEEDRAGGDPDLAVLLIQVKNRKADSPTDGLRRALADDLQKATKVLVGRERPQPVVLGMAMCLRGEGAAVVDIAIPPPVRKSLKRKRPAAAGPGSNEPSNLLGLIFGLDAYPCLFEITAADPQQETMTQMRNLFQEILGKWPDLYPASDNQSEYMKRVLYPFRGDREKVDAGEQTVLPEPG